MTAAPITPDRRPVIIYSRVADCLVVREHAPAADIILAFHLAGQFVASFAVCGLVTLGIATFVELIR